MCWYFEIRIGKPKYILLVSPEWESGYSSAMTAKARAIKL